MNLVIVKFYAITLVKLNPDYDAF